MKNELMMAEQYELALGGELNRLMERELGDFENIPFEMIKIPSGGGIAFEVPGEGSEEMDMVKELEGIIVDHHALNAYWTEEYNGSNETPECSSMDGKQGTSRETGEIFSCATCSKNQYGSAKKGKGKACKNMQRLYFLRSGYPMPTIIDLPPSSIASIRDYLLKKIVLKGLQSNQVVTKIGLKKAVNSDNITYSKAVFTVAGKLEDAAMKEVMEYSEKIRNHRLTSVIEEGNDSDCFYEVEEELNLFDEPKQEAQK